jgi:DNA-binding NarL/FixJ family response regulator
VTRIEGVSTDAIQLRAETRTPAIPWLYALDATITDPKLVETLSDREREVLTCVGEGLTNAEIAERLYLAETTVKTHIGHILSKLGLRDRVSMVITAYDAGLVRPGR